ncbi:MAG: dephospho-CoA kinase [Verrucomicrobiota bacterium]|nr:dephospho-CoA kinase [Limisphaera sp.]MDW8381393.1 dephospho-CoA kinase [Verrucomicrobiota bacterium]
MKRIGLTGGVGMGKSTVAAIFERCGVSVLDTDQLAREVVEPGQPAWSEIVEAFGREVLDASGRLRRAELARLVFADPELRRRLEAITHPRIRDRWQARMSEWQREGRAEALVVIPLLFETGAEGELDCVVCVACTSATQRDRLRARGWSDEEINGRISAQWAIEEKMARAHYVIWTEGALSATQGQVRKLLDRWRSGAI